MLRSQRAKAAAWLLIVIPLGFTTKLYRGPLQGWVNDSLGGILYVLFWCLFAFALCPWLRPAGIAAGVLSVTCCLEFTQLLDGPWLTAVRRNFLGRTLIGTTFTWWDLPHYLAGAVAGWFLLRRLRPGVGCTCIRERRQPPA
jgi:hypothetical protein